MTLRSSDSSLLQCAGFFAYFFSGLTTQISVIEPEEGAPLDESSSPPSSFSGNPNRIVLDSASNTTTSVTGPIPQDFCSDVSNILVALYLMSGLFSD